MLQEFYKHVDKFEVIFVSSDRSVPEFKRYYETMPWLAIPTTTDAVAIKNQLAQKLQIEGIPTVVVIDAKTGNYITNQARVEISDHFSNPKKAKELFEKWKKTESVPIEKAIMPKQGPKGIWKVFYFILVRSSVAVDRFISLVVI